MSAYILMFACQNLIVVIKLDHKLIKLKQMTVSEICSISKIPSSSTVMIAPVIAFSWEIDPLGMSKLVAHEV